MDKKRKFVLIGCVIFLIELVAVGILGYGFYRQKIGVLGATVIPLEKKHFTFTSLENLKYFFEPVANTNDYWGESPSWETPHNYRINSDTLREDINYPFEKPEKTYRLVTLGDSFAFGLYIDKSETFSKVLEKRLNDHPLCTKYTNYEVLNLGVPGYDIAYSVERFFRRGEKYRPDGIIWIVSYYDFIEVYELMKPFYDKYMASPVPEQKDRYLFNKERGMDARNEYLRTYSIEDAISYQKKAIDKLLRSFSGKVIIATSLGDIKSKNVLQEYEGQQKVTVIDDIDLMGEKGTFPDGHPNAEGNRIIADRLFGLLSSSICQ